MPIQSMTFIRIAAALPIAAWLAGSSHRAAAGASASANPDFLDTKAPPCATGDENDAWILQAESEAALARQDLAGPALDFQEMGGFLVVEDDGTLVNGGRAFDLGGKSLRLTRTSPTTFNASVEASQYDPDIGFLVQTFTSFGSQAISLAGGTFPFGQSNYLNLHATSNLEIRFSPPSSPGCGSDPQCMQFTQAEITSDPAPRITPLARRDFWIWSPTIELYVKQSISVVTITWHQVTSSVTSNPDADMYFQVRLNLVSGEILMSYPEATAANTFGAVQVVTADEPGLPVTDISALGSTPTSVNGPLLEAFTFGRLLPLTTWGEIQARYDFDDENLDALAMYQNFYTDLTFYAGAYHTNGRPGVSGIGKDGDKRISLLHMNQLYLSWNRTDQRRVSVLSHEFGHRWLYFVDGVGESRSGPHPAQNAHMPALADLFTGVDSSCMGGSTWTDNLDGTFTAPPVNTYYSYSGAELYLMGIVPPSEVPDWWYVGDNPELTDPYYPPPGQTFTGTKVDLVIGDIINAEGPRIPAYPDTQRDFRVLFLLITRPENPLTQEDKNFMLHVTRYWPGNWEHTILGRGTVATVFPEFVTPFDADLDGDVDLADLPGFLDCLAGPAASYAIENCDLFDADADEDIDLADFAGMQRVFGG